MVKYTPDRLPKIHTIISLLHWPIMNFVSTQCLQGEPDEPLHGFPFTPFLIDPCIGSAHEIQKANGTLSKLHSDISTKCPQHGAASKRSLNSFHWTLLGHILMILLFIRHVSLVHTESNGPPNGLSGRLYRSSLLLVYMSVSRGQYWVPVAPLCWWSRDSRHWIQVAEDFCGHRDKLEKQHVARSHILFIISSLQCALWNLETCKKYIYMCK